MAPPMTVTKLNQKLNSTMRKTGNSAHMMIFRFLKVLASSISFVAAILMLFFDVIAVVVIIPIAQLQLQQHVQHPPHLGVEADILVAPLSN
nr:hypothetical protein [Candidatus Sigynarchaeota archaeon]